MPILLYSGDEAYLIEQAVNTTRRQVLGEDDASGLSQLHHKVLKNPPIAAVTEAVSSVPMGLFGPAKALIEIRDFAPLQKAVKDDDSQAILEQLKEALADVDDGRTVMFIGVADGKLSFTKWLNQQKNVTARRFEAFKFWEGDKAAEALLDIAHQSGINLSQEAAHVLVGAWGNQLQPLVNEMNKLSVYAHGRAITRDDVLKLSYNSDNLFLLMEHWILKRNPAKNLYAMDEILRHRHPVEVLAMLQGSFGTIFRVIWLSTRNTSANDIATVTGQKPFTIKKYLQQYGSVPQHRWLHLKQQLVTLEWKIKTGQLDGQVALDMLLAS